MKYIDILLAQKLGGGGNPEITVEELNATENGTYTAGAGKAYNPVKVNIDVPEIEQLEATENTTYTAPEGKAYGSVVVNVPSSSQALDEVIQCTATSVTSNATKVRKYAFYYESDNLLEVNLPEALTVELSAFEYCSNLRTVTMPKLTSIQAYAFKDCTSIVELNFPELTEMRGSTHFNGCLNLETVNFPKITSLGQGSNFSNCQKLINVNLGNVVNISSSTFQSCKALELLDFKKVDTLNSTCFLGCQKLNTVILRADQICNLNNINAFTGTPFASGGTGGVVYVPQNLINSYRNNNKWSTLLSNNENNQILAIEGSIYEE